ncbi:MAG: HflC protein [Candidatus Omnitrophica bacterium CG11_big_fil_rev_8_21_14_0_20_45_26]|uniref:Protein HflC n=1 Tax=Candidatus Abzuiibacterium crystallinum TaxID=1974748 RepID=A0A2H0LL41_9BACT|nr:MAG: HflC protein [Candidatus Omnitrophica bacterium CG11_big_fil_rev_8_21_14_0_20_45_26]PIW63837.1 MAG: protease modulator HflC [Candidatus Omnitrophica bacterium CG12_big_fil_rev_8_21_14_0_65_45_16]
MNRSLIPFLAGLLVVVILALPQALYIVDETNQAVITRLGKYKRTIKEPGLHLKWPVVEQAVRFDKRILFSDADPGEYLTLDKKRLVADHVTRWRINDPLKFYKTVRSLAGAKARLDDIVFSEMRQQIAGHNFSNIISEERENIMDTVAKSAHEKSKEFGIDVTDVRIKRADLPKEVQASVFARMEAERGRIAKRYRSEGEEEAVKIRASTDKERTIILAQAYEESQRIRGEGDRESTKIYAESYGLDAEFYRFTRSLEAYERILPRQSSIVLSTNSDFLKYLNESVSK